MCFSLAVESVIILSVLFLGVSLPRAECLDFQFTQFDYSHLGELKVNGNDSYVTGGAIQVTPDFNGGDMRNRSGRALYTKPFHLWSSKKLATFNTTFMLNIQNHSGPGGEGLAFILTGDGSADAPVGSQGQWIGILNSQLEASSQAKIVAVEFDTRKSNPRDLDDNHVGLDVNSIYSRKQVSLNTIDTNLSAGNDIKVLIQYDGINLTVFVGKDADNLILSEPVNLSEYLPEKVYVGFSASTGDGTQTNCIKSWEFNGSDVDPKQSWVWTVLIVTGSVFALSIGAVTGCFLYWKRKSQVEDAYPNIEEAIQGSSTAPKKFHLKQLRKATGNFNPKYKLGKGGFGTVYKGILGNKDVAVKRVSKKSTQGKQEFIAEVTTIGNLHHRNLVKLIGWCYERREFLLVYEYLPNGSLDKYIFCNAKAAGMQLESTVLGWETRVSVISGVAQALDYLHNGCEKRVLHRDIKSSNIMLDLEFNAKLGDFGLARTITQNEQTHHSTKELAGTPGYMAPESILTGRATVETDVYAFGVLILEVACGRKPGGQPEQNDYLSNIVNGLWEFYKRGIILDGADPRLNGGFDKEEMERVLILGLACCHPNPNKRPSMKTVLQVLKGEAAPPPVPTERPAFMWPPMPPSFKDWDQTLAGGQLSPFSELSGR